MFMEIPAPPSETRFKTRCHYATPTGTWSTKKADRLVTRPPPRRQGRRFRRLRPRAEVKTDDRRDNGIGHLEVLELPRIGIFEARKGVGSPEAVAALRSYLAALREAKDSRRARQVAARLRRPGN